MPEAVTDHDRLINVNVGILGHVDAGKTTLAKFLSTQPSTACFDKNPQSQSRGITLDLGFSSFLLPSGYQVTLVDCPGHASLLRTVIGGSQIIDTIILVIDATKGIQTQTAECIVLAEIVTDKLIIALTKIDIWSESNHERDTKVVESIAKLRKSLKATKFANCPIIPISNKILDTRQRILDELDNLLTDPPTRKIDSPFLMAVDHCFVLKGQGSILTGTILQGQISVGDEVEVPNCKIIKKIKSIQSFKRSLKGAFQGDRVGLNLGNLDCSLLERVLITSPSFLSPTKTFLMSVNKVPYFKSQINSKSKFHLSMIHETIIGNVSFVRTTLNSEFEWMDGLPQDELDGDSVGKPIMGLVQLENAIYAPPNCLVIASRLDIDLEIKTCRLAFFGKMLQNLQHSNNEILERTFRWKIKTGRIDRIVDEHRIIGRDLVSKNGKIQKFLGMNCDIINAITGETMGKGVITSSFGSNGKFNVSINQPIEISLTFLIRVKFKKYCK